MNLIVWSLVLAAASMAIAVRVTLGARRRQRRARSLIRRLEDRVATLEADLRHAEADRDRISAELDQAYAAAAEVACSRRTPPDSWPDAEQVLLDAAMQLGKLRQQRDALAVELRAVMFDRESLAARAAELERAERVQAARSLRRRAALVRIARHCRMQRIVGDAMVDAGFKLGDQCNRRDAAIEAMTRRIEELMQRARSGAELTNGAAAVERGEARLDDEVRR